MGTEKDESCALDLAKRGGMSLEEVAGLFNTTRERIRQIQEAARTKLRRTLHLPVAR